MKLVGGQLYYYGNGNLLEAAKFWKDLGADIIMLKPHKYSDFFINNFSEINPKYLEILKKIRQMNLQVLLHPEHIKWDKICLEPSDPVTWDNLIKATISLMWIVKELNLYPEICFGPPAFAYPPYKIMDKSEITEKLALENSKKFFTELAGKIRGEGVKISLETMHDPGRNFTPDGRPFKLLCYRPKHFKSLIGKNKNVYNLCVDVGHVMLSKTSLEEYLSLPYQITTLHLHGNKGLKDEHALLTKANAPQMTEKLLEVSSGPIILELRNKEKREDLVLTLAALRENKLP